MDMVLVLVRSLGCFRGELEGSTAPSGGIFVGLGQDFFCFLFENFGIFLNLSKCWVGL